MPRNLSSVLTTFSLLALLGAGCATATPPKTTPEAVTPPPATEPPQAAPAKTYTLEEIAPHNSAENCWLLIAGKVYDVTSFIPGHPGGEAILQGCGKDATAMFTERPDGTAHSPRAEAKLDQFFIGDLKN